MKKYGILFIILTLANGLSAQTLEQAKTMFTKKQYEKAKPVFKRYVKSHPNNASYNYWYGVCCQQTGEPEEAIKPLEFATKRKVQNAPYYLGRAYDELYRFDEAVNSYETYLEALKKKKQTTSQTEKRLEKSKANARMIKGTEEVCIIDSFVVDKAEFLDAYKISEESGSIHYYSDFFRISNNKQTTVYETEIGNRIYYGDKGKDNTLDIFSRNRTPDGWGQPYPLPEVINNSGNANYPFVLTDGITIYYASDGEGSMGGYDIFVTRYNTGTESYMNPENIGMPFNSPDNDYMYVIDEFNNLGWFATDRRQPEDKVCIYVFVPNTYKRTYNYEAMDKNEIIRLARLESIEETWKNPEVVKSAKERLQKALSAKPNIEKVYDFTFVINDQTDYHRLEDFQSTAAKELFNQYRQKLNDYKQKRSQLAGQREQYIQATGEVKHNMASGMIDLEKRLKEIQQELSVMEIEIRKEENNATNRI